MNDRYFILSLAKLEIEKKLKKAKDDVVKKSKNLMQCKGSYARIRNAKIALEKACEGRDRWEKRLEEVNKWIKELKNIEELEETLLAYRKVLEKLEWHSFAGEIGFINNCPMCGAAYKHEEDCELAKVLRGKK